MLFDFQVWVIFVPVHSCSCSIFHLFYAFMIEHRTSNIHQGGPSLAITNEKKDSQPQNSGHWVTILRFTNRNFKPSANTTGNLWKGSPTHIPSGKDEISTTQATPRLTTKELGKGSTSIQTWPKNSTTGLKKQFSTRRWHVFFQGPWFLNIYSFELLVNICWGCCNFVVEVKQTWTYTDPCFAALAPERFPTPKIPWKLWMTPVQDAIVNIFWHRGSHIPNNLNSFKKNKDEINKISIKCLVYKKCCECWGISFLLGCSSVSNMLKFKVQKFETNLCNQSHGCSTADKSCWRYKMLETVMKPFISRAIHVNNSLVKMGASSPSTITCDRSLPTNSPRYSMYGIRNIYSHLTDLKQNM